LTSSIVTYLKGESSLESRVKDILKQAKTMDDAAFLSRMATLADLEPLLAESVTETARLASDYLRGVIQLKVSPLSDQIKVLQRDALRKAFDRELAQARDEAVKSAHATLLDLIANICVIEDARFVGWHSRLTSSSDKSLQKSGHH
jgi:cell division protein FtsX